MARRLKHKYRTFRAMSASTTNNGKPIILFALLTSFIYICQSFFGKNHDLPGWKSRFGASMSHSLRSPDACDISLGEYNGPTYTSESSTVSTSCLVQSKWMRLMMHSVRTLPHGTIVSDWLFIDYHDRINVLVERPGHQGEYVIFRQSKYALEDRESYAIVGGIIESGEDPSGAAVREIAEEMNIECSNLKSLGRYRTDVNRGMGWVNGFVATQCEFINNNTSLGKRNMADAKEEVGAADFENQDVIMMSKKELLLASIQGEFLEVQWSNTVALALLQMEESREGNAQSSTTTDSAMEGGH